MIRRLTTGLAVATAVVLFTAGVASAHIEIDPGEAPQGGAAVLSFAVPNEQDNANTVQVDVQFPADHPIASVSVQPVPGWTAEVKTTQLAKPIESDNGKVTEAVSEITWTGGTITPGQFQQFVVAVDGLPSDTTDLAFPTLQTYSTGDVVRWVEPTVEGQPEPEHPAPVLKLVKDSGGTAAGAAKATAAAKDVATTSDVDSARTVGIIGIAVGALGVILALVALLRRPRGATPAGSGGGAA